MPRDAPADIAAGRIVVAGGAIVVTVGVVVVVVLGWLQASGIPFGGERERDSLPRPSPVLQSAPQLDLRAYRAEKAQALQALGWADARHRVARIPIDDAIELRLQQAAAEPAEATR